MKNYRALVVREHPDGSFSKSVEVVPRDFLPLNDVLIKVSFAGLNYKDALSANGNKGVSRFYPHTPGVDAAGIVIESKHDTLRPGQAVIVTSYDFGMNTKGGFAEYIAVPPHWVVPLPKGLNLQEAMAIGTAGYTAALALHKMEMCGQNPTMGDVVVTGASGGVGSMAVAILAKAGYDVIASSGKKTHYSWLKNLGAKKCVSRNDTSDTSGRPLLSTAWAGAIDTVGGNTLATLLKRCARNGSVATCGLVSTPELNTTVFPFILNGVNLLGVDSAETPYDLRCEMWNKLAGTLKPDNLDKMQHVVSLEEIPHYMNEILKGNTTGRVVADMSK